MVLEHEPAELGMPEHALPGDESPHSVLVPAGVEVDARRTEP